MEKSYRDERTAEQMIGDATRMGLSLDGRVQGLTGRMDAIEKRLAKPATSGQEQPWRSFGEFLTAVQHAGTNQRVDPRLAEYRASGLNGNGAPDEGGFTLPPDFSDALMDMVQYSAPIASRTLRIPATRRSIVLPAIDETSRANGSRWGGVTSSWTNEGDLVTGTKPKFRRLELSLNKLTSLIYATDELNEDGDALGAFVANAFAAEAGYQLDSMIVGGSGSGQPLGILNAPGMITQAAEIGQSSGTIVAMNVMKAFGRMLPESRQRAVWLVSPEMEESIYAAPLISSTGDSSSNLFTPADAGAPFGRLMSRPVLPVEQCSAIGTVGDLIFADLSMYAVYEKPVDVKLSIQVRFLNGEGVYRLAYRVDGAPIIKSAITPKNGGSTKSAFVAIASR